MGVLFYSIICIIVGAFWVEKFSHDFLHAVQYFAMNACFICTLFNTIIHKAWNLLVVCNI